MPSGGIPKLRLLAILEYLGVPDLALATDYYTVLFLTDSVFRVLFAYFDESMASKIVYKP